MIYGRRKFRENFSQKSLKNLVSLLSKLRTGCGELSVELNDVRCKRSFDPLSIQVDLIFLNDKGKKRCIPEQVSHEGLVGSQMLLERGSRNTGTLMLQAMVLRIIPGNLFIVSEQFFFWANNSACHCWSSSTCSLFSCTGKRSIFACKA